MSNLHFSALLFLSIIVPLILFVLITKASSSSSSSTKPVKSYPMIGSTYEAFLNRDRFIQWTSRIVNSTPNLTFSLDLSFGKNFLVTSDVANVQHVLKTSFDSYGKGKTFETLFGDVFGDTMFVADGEAWKSQRQLASREFNKKYFRSAMETAVEDEVSRRLVPVLEDAAGKRIEVDLQDILKRFAFDVICRVAFGHDPGCLSPSMHEVDFALEFEDAVRISFGRLFSISPYVWKTKRALNVGSERRLKTAVARMRDFVADMARKKKKQQQQLLQSEPSAALDDFMSSLLGSNLPEGEITSMVLTLILAGRDTSSSALTWFFWVLSNHPEAEGEILNEIRGRRPEFEPNDDTRKMVCTHGSLCESMRLYPPVPIEIKRAFRDDVLPDGTRVKKGTKVILHIYAMGRVEEVWGSDWGEFKPARWLEEGDSGWRFVGRDPYAYPVFLAAPRACLGRDMAFFQMKRIVAAVLRRFRIVPTGGSEPIPEWTITSEMRGGLRVRVEDRVGRFA